MSLRTRLIIAFLVLSIVPLSAVTLIWYVSSVRTFERAAEREATETAADIGRRMEMVTANVGRRMDRLFDEAVAARGDAGGTRMRDRFAPMLGDTAALLERLEFHPATVATGANANVNPNPKPDPNVNPDQDPNREFRQHRRPRTGRNGRPPLPPGAPPAPADGRGGPPPPPPPPPSVIVVDLPQVLEDARRAARDGAAAGGVDVGAIVAEAMKQSAPAVEAGVAAVTEAITREAIAAAAATKPEMAISGRRIEVPIKKDGKIVGKANAMLNMDRTMRSVLSLARRDQGEIPFAIDQQGRLYTPDARGRGTLESLNVSANAASAAQGSPKRIGDWIVVARKDATGMIFGIARPIGSSLREIRRLSWRNLSVGLAVIALAVIGIVPISHRMTQHVSSLSEGVRQLAGGDFKARVPVQSRDEFGTLAASFNKMAEDLERHQALVVEQERLRRELELSRLIQTEMLPRTSLRLGAAEIGGLSIPAREVGGDFFNYFALPDGRLALLVGDVSGKGVSAALLMANVQATLRARLPLETDLARLADGLDREIDQNTPKSVYVTLFLGILDLEQSRVRYVNAGHNPQFLLRRRGGIEPLSSTGMPIALYAGHGYQESVVDVAAGDLLFFYTDGLVETENEKGEMFGAERLQTLLAVEHEQRIETVLERVDTAVRSFRGHAEPFDDATMMALRIDA
ncbi:MAG TPA: SpoIIE family protein phosphatase [Vicinamibacterales bacterium]|nr:SpoIIE family protein phosphatase [Vicinamibacterales bacterium]